MADYILLQNSDDKVLEEADSSRFRKTGAPPALIPEKGIRWLDLVVVNPAQDDGQIKEGPTVNITDTTYTRTWTVRDKTAKELSDDKDNAATYIMTERGIMALITALNDGSFIPDSNYTDAQLKTIIKATL